MHGSKEARGLGLELGNVDEQGKVSGLDEHRSVGNHRRHVNDHMGGDLLPPLSPSPTLFLGLPSWLALLLAPQTGTWMFTELASASGDC